MDYHQSKGKVMIRHWFSAAMVSLLLWGFAMGANRQPAQGQAPNPKELVDYVNPNIGTIGHLLASTDPIVKMPGGMVELSPNPWPEVMNRCDRYLASKVTCFSLLDVPIYSPKATSTWFMATTGEIEVTPEKRASRYDHDFEIVTPYYSSLLLEDYDITVENAATKNAAYYRFIFPEHSASNILYGADAMVSVVSNTIIQAKARGTHIYIEFSKPFTTYGTWKQQHVYPHTKTQNGNNIGTFVSYATADNESIDVRIGVSRESASKARQNLENEIPNWNFEQVKQAGRDTWNKSLSVVQVEGGTESQRTIFYTGLYRKDGGERLLEEMHLHTEGLREKARKYAARSNDKLFPKHSTASCMFTHPNIIFIAEVYLRGMRDFDIERAYENMKTEFTESTKLPWRNGPITELGRFYLEKGFYPALAPGEKESVREVHGFEKRQSVTITLQAAYESWCIAEIAKALGKTADYEYFKKHAYDYQNVFNTDINFVAPKTLDGKWIAPYDPMLSGGQGGRDYFAEMNGWLYTWYITHDVQGLINLMGGREPFIDKLDQLFEKHYQEKRSKYDFWKQFPDMTGLVGMYTHGNEFSRHIPYLYNYAGAPWITQKRVRDIMSICYDDDPHGICGDEDHGHMSVWYIYAAMGIHSHTINPGYPVWLIGSPIFKQSTLHIGHGKMLTIEARNVSRQNKYIQSALFNEKPLNQSYINHSDIVNGGELILEMGPRPNKNWGSALDAVPPSMSESVNDLP